MSHLWGSLLAEVDQADVACHMVPMVHGGAEDWVQLQLLSQQLHLTIPQHQSGPDVRAATVRKMWGQEDSRHHLDQKYSLHENHASTEALNFNNLEAQMRKNASTCLYSVSGGKGGSGLAGTPGTASVRRASLTTTLLPLRPRNSCAAWSPFHPMVA